MAYIKGSLFCFCLMISLTISIGISDESSGLDDSEAEKLNNTNKLHRIPLTLNSAELGISSEEIDSLENSTNSKLNNGTVIQETVLVPLNPSPSRPILIEIIFFQLRNSSSNDTDLSTPSATTTEIPTSIHLHSLLPDNNKTIMSKNLTTESSNKTFPDEGDDNINDSKRNRRDLNNDIISSTSNKPGESKANLNTESKTVEKKEHSDQKNSTGGGILSFFMEIFKIENDSSSEVNPKTKTEMINSTLQNSSSTRLGTSTLATTIATTYNS